MRTYIKILLHTVKVEKLYWTHFLAFAPSHIGFISKIICIFSEKKLLYTSQERNNLFLNVWRNAENNNYNKQVISKNLLFQCLET